MKRNKNITLRKFDFDSLILNEDDSTIKSMHEYFSQVSPTEQNGVYGSICW